MPAFMIALVLLAACVDAPDIGHEYACTATFYCDDAPFEISPAHGCADDDTEALALFEQRLEELTEHAQCAVKRFEPSCVDTGARCSR